MAEDEKSFAGVTGLANIGNTCYINAAIQALSNCPPFALQFVDRASELIASTFAIQKNEFFKQFVLVLTKLWSGELLYLSPASFVREAKLLNPAIRGYSQQDSQEFLRFLLDQLHEELAAPIVAPTDTPSSSSSSVTTSSSSISIETHRSLVTDIFGGILDSVVECYRCQNKSGRKERFLDLCVEIPDSSSVYRLQRDEQHFLQDEPTSRLRWALQSGIDWLKATITETVVSNDDVSLEQCIAAFCATEFMMDDNMYFCEKCNTSTKATKNIRIRQIPEILCITIKRFKHTALSSSKISSHVVFPLHDLDMSCYGWESDGLPYKYDLVSVVTHYGGLIGGHYVTCAKNTITSRWHQFDDNIVTEVDLTHVLESQAYMLFYRRQGAQSTGKQALLLEAALDATNFVYISKEWTIKYLNCVRVGAITNGDLLCEHGAIHPDKISNIHQSVCQIPFGLWKELQAQFGGSEIPIVALTHCVLCERKKRSLMKEREIEKGLLLPLMTQEFQVASKNEVLYLLAQSWVAIWNNFVNSEKMTAKTPGRIDNSSLLLSNGEVRSGLIEGQHYVVLQETSWKLIHGMYGGGPTVAMTFQQLAERESEEFQ